nr:unnamed protein product [Callosobruchus analis]
MPLLIKLFIKRCDSRKLVDIIFCCPLRPDNCLRELYIYILSATRRIVHQ